MATLETITYGATIPTGSYANRRFEVVMKLQDGDVYNEVRDWVMSFVEHIRLARQFT